MNNPTLTDHIRKIADDYVEHAALHDLDTGTVDLELEDWTKNLHDEGTILINYTHGWEKKGSNVYEFRFTPSDQRDQPCLIVMRFDHIEITTDFLSDYDRAMQGI